MRDLYLRSANLSGRATVISPSYRKGDWIPVDLRHVRYVPMKKHEIAHHVQSRALADLKGRDFAGYIEQCSPGVNAPDSMTMLHHTRSEMHLNKLRGSTEVYVHCVRLGSQAWYHSDIIEHFTDPSWGNWRKWMKHGDPMAMAVEEAHAAGLKIFADIGMNAPYVCNKPHYNVLTEAFAREHPEYLVKYKRAYYLDYRHKAVQDYVVKIVREVLFKYDLDGINIDFTRWPIGRFYDLESLKAVVKRIHQDRKRAESTWGHPISIAVGLYYDPPAWKGLYGNLMFKDALRYWAKRGYVDRVMVTPERLRADWATMPLGEYHSAVAGTGTELWASMCKGSFYYPEGPKTDLGAARNWISQGVNGGIFYYSRDRPSEYEGINLSMRLIDAPEGFDKLYESSDRSLDSVECKLVPKDGKSEFEAGVPKTFELKIRSDKALSLKGLALLFDYDANQVKLDSFKSVVSKKELDVDLSGLYDGEGSFCYSQLIWPKGNSKGLELPADRWVSLGTLVFVSDQDVSGPVFSPEFAKVADGQWDTYHVKF